MNRVIAVIVLATLIPVQVFAGGGLDFDPLEQEHLVKPPVLQEPLGRGVNEKIIEPAPKPVVEVKSGTNWWLWGALGVAAVAGGVFALAGGGGGSRGGSTSTTTTTVTGSW